MKRSLPGDLDEGDSKLAKAKRFSAAAGEAESTLPVEEEEVLEVPWQSPFSLPSDDRHLDEDEAEVVLQQAREDEKYVIQIFEAEKDHSYAAMTGSPRSVEDGKRHEKGCVVVVTTRSDLSVQPGKQLEDYDDDHSSDVVESQDPPLSQGDDKEEDLVTAPGTPHPSPKC